jgi:hypothetical protein
MTEQKLNQDRELISQVKLADIKYSLQNSRSNASYSRAQPPSIKDINMTIRELLTMSLPR